MNYDPQKAARVWQRVQETQDTPQTDNWPALIQDSLGAVAAYRTLARQLTAQSQTFQRLAREEQNTAACLRGICQLAAGQAPPLLPMPAPQERTEVLLRKSYAKAIARVQSFDSRSRSPEFGPVFRRLADQTGAHCQALLEALGRMN